MLEMTNVNKSVDGAKHIDNVSLSFQRGTLNVLLGPTLSGKTSLMRLMAGLDRPDSGEIRFDGADVSGVPVQKRNIAMVYQQFINYPSLSVHENIASPLRLARLDRSEIDERVRAAAALLKLTEYLERKPLTLSGGQQQRTALARALVKQADLVLLDEPLANLDYKLREELRAELPRLFADADSVLVYATSEPSEALLLGGNTATLHEGRVTQSGPAIDVFQEPGDLITAQAFSDPPLNTVEAEKRGDTLQMGEQALALTGGSTALPDGVYRIGIRPHHLKLDASRADRMHITATVSVSEITGSETFIHASFLGQDWIVLVHGIVHVEADEQVRLFFDPDRLYLFSEEGLLVASPTPKQQ